MAKKSTTPRNPAKGNFVRKPPRKLDTREYQKLKEELKTKAARTKFWRHYRITPTEKAWCISAYAVAFVWARDNQFTVEWSKPLHGDEWLCAMYARGGRFLGQASYIASRQTTTHRGTAT